MTDHARTVRDMPTAVADDVYVGQIGWMPTERPPKDLGDPGQPGPLDYDIATTAMPAALTRIVPFGRTLKLGSTGRDVVAVKRGLARAGHGDLTWAMRSGTRLGPIATRNLRRFQKAHGLTVDGVYGLATHRQLAVFFDDYAVWLYTGMKPGATIRDQVVAAALYFHGIRDRVHYTQGPLRMSIVRGRLKPPVAGDVYEDCSSFVTGLYWIAGAPDPNGRGYDGFGFTGTLAEHGRSIGLVQARPGDLVFYGHAPPWKHVAVIVATSRAVSHGSEGGPFLVDPHYRPDLGDVRSYL